MIAGFLGLVGLLLSSAYHSCVIDQPLEKSQNPIGWLSLKTDLVWGYAVQKKTEEAQKIHRATRKKLLEELSKIRGGPDLIFGKQPTSPKSRYGKLPTVYADQGMGAEFPVPISKPDRISWFDLLPQSRSAVKTIHRLKSKVDQWSKTPEVKKLKAFSKIEPLWIQANQEVSRLNQDVRYLKTWLPRLKKTWLKKEKEFPIAWKNRPIQNIGHFLALMIQYSDPSKGKPPVEWKEFAEFLRPRRVFLPHYLPATLKKNQTVEIPIRTDISDQKFLREMEGAVDTHWNDSPWAQRIAVRFKIKWIPVEKNPNFKSLRKHLDTFPEKQAGMTTGGLTTYVSNHVMVLGPEKITPRTLAHEFGHLLGFDDCYIRTLSGQGSFGVAILEWNNPIYPDDLMCDNLQGVARAEVW